MLLVPSVEVTKGEPQPPVPRFTFQPLAMAGGSVAVMRKVDENRVAIVVGAERDIGALFRPIGDGRLEDSTAGNLGDGYRRTNPAEVVSINQIRIAVLTQCNHQVRRRCIGHVHQQWA